MCACFMRWESAKQRSVKYVNIRDQDNEEKEKPNGVRKGRGQMADHKREMEKEKRSAAWWFLKIISSNWD